MRTLEEEKFFIVERQEIRICESMNHIHNLILFFLCCHITSLLSIREFFILCWLSIKRARDTFFKTHQIGNLMKEIGFSLLTRKFSRFSIYEWENLSRWDDEMHVYSKLKKLWCFQHHHMINWKHDELISSIFLYTTLKITFSMYTNVKWKILLGLYQCRICIIAWLGYSIRQAFFSVLLMELSWSSSQVYLEMKENRKNRKTTWEISRSKKITFFLFLFTLHSLLRIKQLTNEKYIFKTFHIEVKGGKRN